MKTFSALTTRTALAYLAAVFTAGAVAGGTAGYTAGRSRKFQMPKPDEISRKACSKLDTELGLDPQQSERMAAIVRESVDEIGRIQDDARRRSHEIIKASHAKMKTFLTPDQSRRLDEMDRKLEERFKPSQSGPRSPRERACRDHTTPAPI